MARRGDTMSLLAMAICLSMALVAAPTLAHSPANPLGIVFPRAPTGLDPHLEPTEVADAILGNVFEGLVGLQEDRSLKPILAENWQLIGDRAWRFEIRQGVRFHSGKTMTSDDVVQSLERARTHPESVSPVLLDSVSRVVAEGRYTIRIELKKPDAVLLKKLVSIAIVPGGAPHRIFEPVGTGPYRVVDSDPGKSLSLEAFADYWGEASGQEHIKVFFEEDQGASLELLRSKKADLVVGLRPELVEEVEKSPDLWVESTLGALVHVLGLNAHQPPFDDPVVREAIDEALDRNGLAEDVFLKYCRPAGQLVNQMAYGFSPDIDAVERNLTRARALLLAAPSDSPISFTLEFREGSEVLADTIKRQLSEAGVQVVLQPRPWSELLPRLLEGEVQAGLFTWRNSQMDVGFLFDIALHSKSPIHAKLGYSSPETDRLVVACQTTLDPSARLELLYSIAGRVAHDRVLLPLVWGLDLYGVRRDIEWTPPPSGVIDLRTISRRSPS